MALTDEKVAELRSVLGGLMIAAAKKKDGVDGPRALHLADSLSKEDRTAFYKALEIENCIGSWRALRAALRLLCIVDDGESYEPTWVGSRDVGSDNFGDMFRADYQHWALAENRYHKEGSKSYGRQGG